MKNQLVAITAYGVAACAALLTFGSGIATADPDVIGKKYGEAKGLFGQANLTPVVATVLGDRVPQDECFVVSTSKLTSRDSSGRPTSNQVQVNLSCYARPADTTTPGFSAANSAPEAEAVREVKAEADKKWKASPQGQEWCAKTLGEHPEWTIEGCTPLVQ